MAIETDDLPMLLMATQWPFLLAAFVTVMFSALKIRSVKGSTRNLERLFENFRFGGHRGSPTIKPENTIASMQQAHSEGVDLIEFDVSLTKDGVAVILHDDTLDRTTDMTGPVRSFLHWELKHCNTAAKFIRPPGGKPFASDSALETMSLPTLDEMVEWAKRHRMKMIFDVKDTDWILCEKLFQLFDDHDLYSLGVVCSFHPIVVYRLKNLYPEIPTGITWRRWQFSMTDAEGTIPRYSYPVHFAARLFDMIYAWSIRSTILPRFLGADMVLTHRAEISEGYVKYQHKKGLKVCAWTVNDPDEMTWMHKTLRIPFLTDVPHIARQKLQQLPPSYSASLLEGEEMIGERLKG